MTVNNNPLAKQYPFGLIFKRRYKRTGGTHNAQNPGNMATLTLSGLPSRAKEFKCESQ